jgi:8-amino-7-oxononanoate synthase
MQPATPTADSSLHSVLNQELDSWRERGLERRLRRTWNRNGAEVMTDDGPAVDFSSNDYLGLASDPRLARVAAAVMAEQGTGATASRLIAGNHPEHEALEVKLAEFLGLPAALSFGSGWAANVGTIPALVGRDDVVFADALNHASLIDGCRLSRATIHIYEPQNSGSLARLMDAERSKHRRALIVTDGVFSMDGDVAPLRDIVLLARQYDAWTYLDDAHGIGVLGEQGRGTAETLSVLGDIDVLVGTFGKAFGAAGAFVAGPAALRDHLLNRARSFVFSTAVPPGLAAAAREALRIAAAEPERRGRVRSNVKKLWSSLRASGIEPAAGASTHIVPILVGDADETMRVGRDLRARGFLVGAVRPPTVPDGTSRLRVTVTAAHTAEHIDRFVTTVAALLRGE